VLTGLVTAGFLSRCIEQLASRTTDAALNAAVTLRLVEISFRYIDRVSEELISVYQQERDDCGQLGSDRGVPALHSGIIAVPRTRVHSDNTHA
jgi:hypothetical protein